MNAKDVPKPGVPVPAKKKDEIVMTLTDAAATLCTLIVSSGSFLIGAVCGLIVAVGILKAQDKNNLSSLQK
jgi:hypothetical protein